MTAVPHAITRGAGSLFHFILMSLHSNDRPQKQTRVTSPRIREDKPPRLAFAALYRKTASHFFARCGGKGFAGRKGLIDMEIFGFPICITIEVRKTRTGWIITVRVHFEP